MDKNFIKSEFNETGKIIIFNNYNRPPKEFTKNKNLYIFYEIKDGLLKLITKDNKRWGEFCVTESGEICGEMHNIDYDVGIEALTYVLKNLERLEL